MSYKTPIWKYILFIVLITLLSSCGIQNNTKTSLKSEEQSSLQEKKESLTLRITWKTYSGRGVAIRKIVDSYNAINQTNYEISVIDGDEDLESIESLLESNDAVDLYVLPYRYVQYLGYNNKLQDLTSSFANEESLFYEKLWELGVVEQKVYGIPWLGHSMGLIYNKNLLRKAGVEPSNINSLDKLVAACKQVEENTDAHGIGLVGAEHNDISWMVNQFIYGFGGTLVNSQGMKVTINSSNAKAAIEFYKNDLGAYAQDTWLIDSGVEVMDYFREQQIAFEIQGLWGITDIWKNGRPFETGVIPLENIGLYAEVGPMMLALQPHLNEEKKTAAIQFIQYLISIKAQEMIMDGEYSPEHDAYYPFRLPVRKDITDSIVFEKYPEFSMFLTGFSEPSIDVPVPQWQLIKDEYYAPGLHLVMENKMSIDDFLQEIQDQGDKILMGEK
ncbi:MAG: sugar ABC transporter substrate-binding protein [Firmicutes bacterium HGW-Firmicutes-1]|jgi:multiple sugar transport system substrate-binding protein|nr:MAG: sugar ABC transporter substrate-binding protein [Firmicutes bacterium HGW-Firmicutes-1]